MLEDIMKTHNLNSNVHNNRTCIRIGKEMCGLQETLALANEQLRQNLDTYGCRLTKCTLFLQKDDSNKGIFTLLVDDFGVKYLTKERETALINALKYKHEYT